MSEGQKMPVYNEEKDELIDKLEGCIYKLTVYYTSSKEFREDVEMYVENAIQDCEVEWN